MTGITQSFNNPTSPGRIHVSVILKKGRSMKQGHIICQFPLTTGIKSALEKLSARTGTPQRKIIEVALSQYLESQNSAE